MTAVITPPRGEDIRHLSQFVELERAARKGKIPHPAVGSRKGQENRGEVARKTRRGGWFACKIEPRLCTPAIGRVRFRLYGVGPPEESSQSSGRRQSLPGGNGLSATGCHGVLGWVGMVSHFFHGMPPSSHYEGHALLMASVSLHEGT